MSADIEAMRKLIANRDVGFRERGERTLRHIWTSETDRRPLTAREKRALQTLIDAGEVLALHAVGSYGRGSFEFRGGVLGRMDKPTGQGHTDGSES